MIYSWREIHEQYIASKLGSKSDALNYQAQIQKLDKFSEYSPIIRRIILDKPQGWEWRLTAELLREINEPLFRKLNDLRSGLYFENPIYIEDEDLFDWIGECTDFMSRNISSLEKVLNRFNNAWGEPGKEGDVDEIYHTCILLKGCVEKVLEFEEKVHFVQVSESARSVVSLLENALGSQLNEISSLPDYLDGIVSVIDGDHDGTPANPLVFNKEIKFNLPEGWSKKMNKEMKSLKRKIYGSDISDQGHGCSWMLFLALIIVLIIMF